MNRPPRSRLLEMWLVQQINNAEDKSDSRVLNVLAANKTIESLTELGIVQNNSILNGSTPICPIPMHDGILVLITNFGDVYQITIPTDWTITIKN